MEDRKKKVLIVDDEKNVGALVNSLIHWDELNLECMSILTDGRIALETIKTRCPDIVITDVKMPAVSGLDIIKNIREIGLPVNFIIMSGYQEFDYVQKAIEYGVEQYIVKPIDEDKLNETIKKIVSKLRIAESKETEIEQLKEKSKIGDELIQKEFLANLLIKGTDETNNDLIEMPGDTYRGLDIKLDYLNSKKKDIKQSKIVIDYIKELAGEHLRPYTEKMMISEMPYQHICCLLNYDRKKDMEMLEKISSLLNGCKEYLRAFDLYCITIGIGSAKEKKDEIAKTLSEAKLAVYNRLLFGTGRLIKSELINPIEDFSNEELLSRHVQGVVRAVDVCAVEDMRKSLNELFNMIGKDKRANASVYYRAAESIINSYYDGLDLKQEKEKAKNELIDLIHNCCRIPQMYATLDVSLTRCIENIQKIKMAQSTKPVRLAQQYIREHFSEKILLEDIADIVGLNSVYFSALFKKETGMNFSTYLIDVRMERAKELLVETNKTVTAIGLEVGYTEQKYFLQQFKKVVGVKPSVYRQLHS